MTQLQITLEVVITNRAAIIREAKDLPGGELTGGLYNVFESRFVKKRAVQHPHRSWVRVWVFDRTKLDNIQRTHVVRCARAQIKTTYLDTD